MASLFMIPLRPDKGKRRQEQPRQGRRQLSMKVMREQRRAQAGKQKSASQNDLLFSPPSDLPCREDSVIAVFLAKQWNQIILQIVRLLMLQI